jgi:hypothetical protein
MHEPEESVTPEKVHPIIENPCEVLGIDFGSRVSSISYSSIDVAKTDWSRRTGTCE